MKEQDGRELNNSPLTAPEERDQKTLRMDTQLTLPLTNRSERKSADFNIHVDNTNDALGLVYRRSRANITGPLIVLNHTLDLIIQQGIDRKGPMLVSI